MKKLQTAKEERRDDILSPSTQSSNQVPSSPHPGRLDSVLTFLSSIRLGIYLLLILVLISFVGTIIPQKPNTQPEVFQRMFAPPNLALLESLGILDIFHSGWFKALLTLLGLNIVFASLDRFSTAWRFIQRPARVLSEPVIRAQQQHAELYFNLDCDTVEAYVKKQLHHAVGAPAVHDKEGRKVLFAQRNAYARLAAYGIHLSLLVIFAGGLIGLQLGYRGRVSLNEGQSTSKVILMDTSRSVVEAAVEPRMLQREMGFVLKHERAEVVFNNPSESSWLRQEDIQSPERVKNWYCTLSVWENGVKQKTAVIAVNQPFTYRGFRFFQSGFDFGDGFKAFTFQVRSKDSRQSAVYRVRKGESFLLQEAHLVATPLRSGIMPDAGFPFAVLSLKSNGTEPEKQLAVFDQSTAQKMRNSSTASTEQTTLPNGAEIFLTGAVPEFSTTLQVSRDPGVTMVWAGCVLLVLGLMVAFYFSHQRVWAMLIPVGSGTKVVLGGDTNKNRPGFAGKFARLEASLRERTEKHSKVAI